MPPRRKALQVAYHAPADAQVAALMKSSDALVIPAVGPKLAPELFEGASLKLVQVTGAGVDRLDQAALTRLGIPVANVAGGSNGAVAEYAVTAASMLLRRFAWADAEIKSGNYAKFRARMVADNLAGIEGLQVGLIGFGTIGRAVAQAFVRMGAKVCFFDPAPADAKGIDARRDVVGRIACNLRRGVAARAAAAGDTEPDRRGELSRMKPGAVLIQASRGGIVDEAALAASLVSGHLGGAAVDVYSTEPPAPDNPLLKLTGEAASRLLLTPHIAGVTRQASAFLFRSAWQNVERVLMQNQPPLNRVY